MTDERIEEVLFEVNGKLAKIDAKLDSLSETILKHEARISKLETDLNKHLIDTVPTKDDNFKTELLKLLSKSVIIGLVIIASLTGCAGLISKILGL